MQLGGEILHPEAQEGQEDQSENCQPPFQVEKESDSPKQTEEIPEREEEGVRKEPAQTLDVVGQAGHQVTGGLMIEKGFRQAKGPVPEVLLDIAHHFRFHLAKMEFLDDIQCFFEQGNQNQEKNRPAEKIEPVAQDDLIDQVSHNEGRWKAKERKAEDEKTPDGSPFPVPANPGPKGFQIFPNICPAPPIPNRILG